MSKETWINSLKIVRGYSHNDNLETNVIKHTSDLLESVINDVESLLKNTNNQFEITEILKDKYLK